MNILLERLIWIVNGFLVLLYSAAGNLHAIVIAVSALFFVASTPPEQQRWAAGAGLLAFGVSLTAPAPVPVFLLLMSLAGWLGLYLEQYNRVAQRWNIIRALALYALAGLGFTAYRAFGLDSAMTGDPLMTQGAAYLNGLLGIAMYVIPIGFLAWLAQSIWAHPPAPAAPEDLINTVRARKR